MKRMIIAISMAIAAATVVAQEKTPMSQDDAIAYFKGKEVNGSNAKWTIRFKFEENGTVWGNNTAGGSDNGSYTIENGRICFSWRRWNNSCGQLFRFPDDTVQEILDDGKVWLTFKK